MVCWISFELKRFTHEIYQCWKVQLLTQNRTGHTHPESQLPFFIIQQANAFRRPFLFQNFIQLAVALLLVKIISSFSFFFKLHIYSSLNIAKKKQKKHSNAIDAFTSCLLLLIQSEKNGVFFIILYSFYFDPLTAHRKIIHFSIALIPLKVGWLWWWWWNKKKVWWVFVIR